MKEILDPRSAVELFPWELFFLYPTNHGGEE